MGTKHRSLPEITEDTKRSWKRIRHDLSAGGVAYRCTSLACQWEIALIATRGGQRWQLPKGSREHNETPLETALREVQEEVGLETECVQKLRSIDYWYWDTYRKTIPELVHKTVDFFLLRVTGGLLSSDCFEVDDAAWYPIDRALKVLTFKGERSVVRMARQVLESTASTALVADD